MAELKATVAKKAESETILFHWHAEGLVISITVFI